MWNYSALAIRPQFTQVHESKHGCWIASPGNISSLLWKRAGASHDSNSWLGLKIALFDESWVADSISYWINFHATSTQITQPQILGWVIFVNLNRINAIDWITVSQFESRVVTRNIYWIGSALLCNVHLSHSVASSLWKLVFTTAEYWHNLCLNSPGLSNCVVSHAVHSLLFLYHVPQWLEEKLMHNVSHQNRPRSDEAKRT